MKLRNIDEITEFLSTVDSCRGEVWLESIDGSRFNLKSKMSQYIAIGALLTDHNETLELFCGLKEEEGKFFKFFIK